LNLAAKPEQGCFIWKTVTGLNSLDLGQSQLSTGFLFGKVYQVGSSVTSADEN
jgi:hypothetical protein